MAEALVNHAMGGEWQAFSAGTKPAGYVHPLALRALEEMGIRHEGVSKHLDQFRGQPFDVVITTCDDAAENCPAWFGSGNREHIGFPDPADAAGSDEDKMAAFRQVRDDMQTRVLAYLRKFAD